MLIAPAPPVPIVTVDRPTQVSAYGSGVLFSKRDPATGRFKLWYTETGRPPAPLPVADRSVPFDADLGPGAHGHFLAVYSRCEREPRWDPVDEDTPPNYSLGRGCDLYELDLTTERERRLTADVRQRGPAGGLEGRARVRPRLLVEEDRALPPHGQRDLAPDAGRAGRTGARTASTSTGAGWRSAGSTRAATTARPPTCGWTTSQTARARLIERFRGGGLTTISLTAPAFEGGKLYYAKLCQGDESGCPGRAGLIRVRYSTGERARAKIGRYDLWQARGEGVTYVLHDDEGARSCFSTATGGPQETCTLLATTPDYE